MDITTAGNTATEGEAMEGEGRHFANTTFKKSQSYKMFLICESLLLLVSFLCHVIGIVHDTEKGKLLYPFHRRAPKPQVTHKKRKLSLKCQHNHRTN